MDENIISLEKKLIEELTTKKEKIEIELNKLNYELQEINNFLFKLSPETVNITKYNSGKTQKAIFLLEEMKKNKERITLDSYKNKLYLNSIVFSRAYYNQLFKKANLYYKKNINAYAPVQP